MSRKGTMKQPTEREMETLGELEAANRNLGKYGRAWARPLDCGGSSGSHHGATLAKLATRGYAERSGHRGQRRTNYYKITPLGLTMLGHWQRQKETP